MINITVKKSFQIAPREWEQIADGFNEAFSRDKKPEDLKKFYEATVLGFSYHASAFADNGELAGHTTFAPMYYTTATGERILTCLSGGSYVKKVYRNDIFIFKDMYLALAAAVKEEGAAAVLGVPNKNSYKYFIKLLNARLLYYLPYYVLPLRLNKLIQNKLIGAGSFLFHFLIQCYLGLLQGVAVFFNPKEKNTLFRLDYPKAAFLQRFNDKYTTVQKSKYQFTYRIYEEKDISTAYIFDFTENGERTFRSLIKCCWHIAFKERADIIAFVGILNLKQLVLFRLPQKKEPKKLPLVINVLVEKENCLFNELSNSINWNFGLMNFDAR
jgi:hypothetical protein